MQSLSSLLIPPRARQINASRCQQNFSTFGLPDLPLQLTGQESLDLNQTIHQLKKIYRANGISLDISAVYFQHLTIDGIFTIPLLVDIGPYTYAIFFLYQQPDCAKWLDARQQLQQLSNHRAVYLSQLPVDEKQLPRAATELLRLDHFRWAEIKTPKTPYAMWWPTEKDPDFVQSNAYQHLKKIYQSLAGYESYFIGKFLRVLGLSVSPKEEIKRYGLPNQERTITIIGPDDQIILMAFSKDKGIRLLFSVNQTPTIYRDQLLEQLQRAIYMYTLKLQLRGLPQDVECRSKGLEWISRNNSFNISNQFQ